MKAYSMGRFQRVVGTDGRFSGTWVVLLASGKLEPGYFFPGQDDGHLSPRYVGKLIRDLLPDQWTMHTLRHRFATRLYAHTRDLLGVQGMLGHATPTTTRRYVQWDTARMRDAVDELAG